MAKKTITHLTPGMTFAGDFEVIEPLSAGGMGAIYIVQQRSTGKRRALKLMHPELLADAKLRQRFSQEARVSALVDSEHVVEVVSAGVDEDSSMPWLAMELLRGESLKDALSRRKRLTAAETRAVFRQLCHAVGAAHRAGIVHRDLKPDNIFLSHSRRADSDAQGFMVKVLDFGIAKVLADAATKGTASLGTPMWMAPEQTSSTAAVDARADVWSLGLIAFTSLTGMYYWRCAREGVGSIGQLMRELLFEELVPASDRAKDLDVAEGTIPDGFNAWFARCVARDEKARFANATEMFDALDPILRDAKESPTAAAAAALSSGDVSAASPLADTIEDSARAPLGTGTLVAGSTTLSPLAEVSEVDPVAETRDASSEVPPSPTPTKPAERPRFFVASAMIAAVIGIGGFAAYKSNSASTAAATPKEAESRPSAAVASIPAPPSASNAVPAVESAATAADAAVGAAVDAGEAPVSAAEHRKRAKEALDKKNYGKAKAEYEVAFSMNQKDHLAICGVGDVYRAKGEKQNAAKFYLLCRHANPGYLPAHLGEADMEWDAGQREIARGQYKLIVATFPAGQYPAYVTERAREPGVAPPPPGE
jgi:eukaryotic-like serine/threonine-protein kinase